MSNVALARTATSSLRAEVAAEIHAIFIRSASAAESYGPDFSLLWQLAARQATGGKLVRPLLLLETYDALLRAAERAAYSQPAHCPAVPAARDRRDVVRIAAAIEALHFAFLLHDDVIDNSFHRRGRPNLIGELAQTAPPDIGPDRSRHWAQTGGILAGNLLLSAAHLSFARANLPGETKLRLLDALEHTVFETTAGEFTDVGLSDGIVRADLGTVLAMTGRKTASYSFELPLRVAVVLSGGSDALADKMSIAGGHLGLAYQLQDDLLSTFGNANDHGKDTYSDLREGKQTAIVCFARSAGAWPFIEHSLGDPEMSVAEAERLRDILRDCGAEAFVQRLIRDQVDAFSRAISGSGPQDIPTDVQEVLRSVLARIDGRQA